MQEIFILIPFSEWHWRKYKSLLSIFCHVFRKSANTAPRWRRRAPASGAHEWTVGKSNNNANCTRRVRVEGEMAMGDGDSDGSEWWRSCSSIKHSSSFYCVKIVCKTFVCANFILSAAARALALIFTRCSKSKRTSYDKCKNGGMCVCESAFRIAIGVEMNDIIRHGV